MAGKEKRKRVSLTLETKLELIRAIRDGCSQRLVSEKFGVPKSTVADIWNCKEKIEEHLSASEYPELAKRRKIIKRPIFDKADQACFLWFSQQRSKGAAISGPLLQEKAKDLYHDLHPPGSRRDDFKASSEWLEKFCIRHGIKQVSLQGELLSADFSAVEPFVKSLAEIIAAENYSLHQIFNADGRPLVEANAFKVSCSQR